MKKRIISLIMVAVMILSLAACGKKEEVAGPGDTSPTGTDSTAAVTGEAAGADNSLQYIQDKGKFILGLDDAFPPMGFRDDDNNIVGFDIDLAQAVCDKLGWELVMQPIKWEAKEQELATKNIDCIWNGFSITPDRLNNLTMSEPYMENKIALVVKKDSSIKSQADMAGKKLAVQGGSSAAEALDMDENKVFKDSLGEVNEFADYVTALMDMETGSSDAVLMDSVVANYMITEAGKDFVILNDSLVSEQYAVGFRKGDEALCKAVEDALKDLKADGTVAEISTKWFGSDITTIQ